MAAPTYPASSDVTSGQATLSSHYNNLRADAARLGAGVADGGTLGDLLVRYSRHVVAEYLATDKIRIPYSATRVPSLIVNGYVLRATVDVDSAAVTGTAGTRYLFAVRSSASTTFTLAVSTSATEATDQRLIGQFYWSGTAILLDTIQSEELTGIQPLIGRCNLDATSAPTVNDDSVDGYSVGSIWADVTADRAYLCLDATATAAVWAWMAGGLSLAAGITVSVTGGGTLALGGYTLTIPATGTAALTQSPTLITPVLGVATATTINKVTLTAPATGSTLTIADGKTLTLTDSLTVQGGGATTLSSAGAYTLTIPATGTAALLATANVFTGPGSLLHLYSTSGAGGVKLKIQSTVVDSYPGIDFINDARSWNIAVDGSSDGSASDALVFYDSTALQYRMVILTNGNVLVGTTTDSGKLTVNGEIALVDGMAEPGTTSGWAKLYVDSDHGDLKIKFGDGTVKTIVVDE